MSFNLQFSPDDALIVEAILAPFSTRAKRPLSLEHLLERWSNFVREVGRGYADSIYEYTNDLSTRDILETVVQQAPQPLHDGLNAILNPIDVRYNELTQVIQRSLGSSQNPWWFRIPKNLSDELKDDLQAEGFLQ
jgi:hypothetical protein